MSELKFCPFCGGRQTYYKHDGDVWLTTTNHKRGCIMRDALAFVAFDTEAEAIEAWNTRAERTCHAELNESRKIRFEVECTLEEFAEFLDVIEPFGDKWASRIYR